MAEIFNGAREGIAVIRKKMEGQNSIIRTTKRYISVFITLLYIFSGGPASGGLKTFPHKKTGPFLGGAGQNFCYEILRAGLPAVTAA